MKSSLSCENLNKYLMKQIQLFFPDDNELNSLFKIVEEALEKLEFNFKHIALKHYYKDQELYFNHLNADQYTVFIYYASYIAYKKYDNVIIATKLFYLNKTLHQFHCMYNTELPDIFVLIHGTGIVLGKAQYSNYLVISQHCTIGANEKVEYPFIEENVIIYPNSSIIGATRIGENSCVSHGTFINNEVIKKRSLIIGKSPNLIIKNDLKERFNYFFIKSKNIDEK